MTSKVRVGDLIKLPRHLYLLHEAQDRLTVYIGLLEKSGVTNLDYGKGLVRDINSHIETELEISESKNENTGN